MKLSFVIPVFNEQDSLKILHSEILENIKKYKYEIIFIDDGSNDDSFQIMTELAKKDENVKIIKFRKNFGKSAALQTGFDVANGEIVFTMDADLQDNPKEIPNFITKIEAGFDLVTGWKVKRRDPINKTWPSKIFNSVTSKTFGLKLHDYNCGFKAYQKSVINEIDVYGEMHRYIPALAIAKGFTVAEIPIEHRKREFGKSKYGIERYLRGFLDLLTVKLVTGYIRSPLYLFGRIGATFGLIGLIITIYLSVMKFWFSAPLSNRPLLYLGTLLIIIGLQFFSIGLLGELIVNQGRNHTKKKNISIEKRINL
ncbi:MAG: glycosyltransferase family 2 protein [Candidatus Cloacimonetes bacterium]|jgi:glycosyltransferase involved in cell wall biosynthesis|nr:glycosyltransferase family 2 protein [Candidatus Cloacimonadota bacterium]MBT6993483.1 glycosyltransferase family 2 protein [Candidatus Cloacimonadota bacterium]MBT7468789.1 glycosyltransferase family 2 protein [Candidatus Cloacimonadota bacterium]